MSEHSFHMSSEDFRRYGHQMIDWLADYQLGIETRPVLSRVQPGDIRRQLPPNPPDKGESFEKVLADIETVIMPGVTHWQSPNFYAYFPSNTSGPSILGELLSAGLGVQGMLWATSPACTELEIQVLDWVAQMLALPDRFRANGAGGAVIQDSASSAALCALLAARERATGLHTNDQGGNGQLVAFATAQAHSSIEKAMKIAGIGRANLHIVETDANQAMNPDALSRAVAADRASGKQPFFVSTTVGTTSSNAFDPLPEIGAVCRANNLWFHVDGAMCGTAALCPEFRWIHRGLELADSYCFNPHKWMFTNFDCDCFYVADRKALIQALTVLPEYLRNKATESGAVIDYRDWQVPLGRRFRSLKLWFVIRHYGIAGLQHHIREHVRLAQELASWIKADPDFEVVAPAPLNLVCFAHKAGDELNRRLLDTLNESGRVFLTHTVLNGRYVLRMCVGQTYTEERHVRQAWDLIRSTAAESRNDYFATGAR